MTLRLKGLTGVTTYGATLYSGATAQPRILLTETFTTGYEATPPNTLAAGIYVAVFDNDGTEVARSVYEWDGTQEITQSAVNTGVAGIASDVSGVDTAVAGLVQPVEDIRTITATIPAGLASILAEALTARKAATNRVVVDPTTAVISVYDDDGTTVLYRLRTLNASSTPSTTDAVAREVVALT